MGRHWFWSPHLWNVSEQLRRRKKKKCIKSHTDDLETGTDNFWIASIQNQSPQTNPMSCEWTRAWAENVHWCPASLSPLAFPERLSQSFHSLEGVGERSAFIISVCRALAFKANARSSVWGPSEGGGGRRAGIIGRGRTDPGAVPGSPGRGRQQDSSAVTVGNCRQLGFKGRDAFKTFHLVWCH